MLNSCYCVKSCVDTAELIKEARKKRQALNDQEFNEYEEGKEAKFEDPNDPNLNVNAHGKISDSGSLDHIQRDIQSPANYEFNFINISLPVPTFGSGHNSTNSNGYHPQKSEAKSTSDHGAETDTVSGSSEPPTIGYTSSNDSNSSNELEPMRTDEYPAAEEEDDIVAFSPLNMAKRVQFTESQHILTHSGTSHVVPHNQRRPPSKARTRSKSLDMDDLEGSETKCCPRRKDGSFAILTMWRH